METKKDSHLIYDGNIIKVYKDTVLCENGNLATREIVRHHGGVGILAIKDHKILLVKQYRYAYACDTIEIPAGKLEHEEDTKACAMRELEEETGYQAQDLTLISKIMPTPGYCDEWLYIYLAKNITKAKNPLSCDEDEFIDIIEMDIEKAYQKVLDGTIMDSKTVVAIMYAYINLK